VVREVKIGTENTLQQWFPSAGKNYLDLTLEEMKMYAEKNFDYAKGGSQHGNFERVATILKQYPNLDLSNPVVVAFVYMMKQMDAALWLLSEKHEAKVQGFDERMADVTVYSKIIRLLAKEEKK
jgi:hypothetical protein